MKVLSVGAADVSSDLIRARLPRWSLGIIAAGVVVATAVLFAATPLASWVGFVLTAAGLYVFVLTAVSIRVEGRRAATDRLITSVVVA